MAQDRQVRAPAPGAAWAAVDKAWAAAEAEAWAPVAVGVVAEDAWADPSRADPEAGVSARTAGTLSRISAACRATAGSARSAAQS